MWRKAANSSIQMGNVDSPLTRAALQCREVCNLALLSRHHGTIYLVLELSRKFMKLACCWTYHLAPVFPIGMQSWIVPFSSDVMPCHEEDFSTSLRPLPLTPGAHWMLCIQFLTGMLHFALEQPFLSKPAAQSSFSWLKGLGCPKMGLFKQMSEKAESPKDHRSPKKIIQINKEKFLSVVRLSTMVKQLCAVGLSSAPAQPWISTPLSQQSPRGHSEVPVPAFGTGWANPLWACPGFPVGHCLGWTTSPCTSLPATPAPPLPWAGSPLVPGLAELSSLPCPRGGLQPAQLLGTPLCCHQLFWQAGELQMWAWELLPSPRARMLVGCWTKAGSTALNPPGGPGERMGVMTELFRLHVVNHQAPLQMHQREQGSPCSVVSLFCAVSWAWPSLTHQYRLWGRIDFSHFICPSEITNRSTSIPNNFPLPRWKFSLQSKQCCFQAALDTSQHAFKILLNLASGQLFKVDN